jgi:hypothetical protein
MQIFSKLDVYSRKYTYDEMKVMCLIDTYHTTYNLEYEDLCCIVEAVYSHWIDGRDASEDEKYAKYPWLEFRSDEEDGYIQVYAQRVLPEFIKLYKEEINND